MVHGAGRYELYFPFDRGRRREAKEKRSMVQWALILQCGLSVVPGRRQESAFSLSFKCNFFEKYDYAEETRIISSEGDTRVTGPS